MVSLVYMVAGISSRFGGKIKQLSSVGPNGETFIECSLNQALTCNFSKIIFIVGNLTEQPFKDKFGDSYKGVPVLYTKQTYNPEDRDKPWGTADAVATIENIVDEPCVICNGDDLYGEQAFKIIFDHLQNTNEDAATGLPILEMLPDDGEVTRGIFTISNNYLTSASEIFNISKANYIEKGLKDRLCNMNLFGLQPETIKKLSRHVINLRHQYSGDRKKEIFIHVELSNLVKLGEIKMKIYPYFGRWIGLTNPEDEQTVREMLKNQAI